MSSGKITSSADSSSKGSPRTNAIRERSRVQSLRDAFQSLQLALPAVPPSTKLSKLDVLLMASAYIAHLGRLVESDDDTDNSNETATVAQESASVFAHIHPVKKWPMRARFYYGLDLSSKSHQKSPGCPYNRPTHIRSSSLN